MTHAWCTDPGRDAAVRAAEDGRDGALPTLEEAIAGMFPKNDSASSAVEPENKGDSMATDGLRTERVTLEITHPSPNSLHEWQWDMIVRRYCESVRVVEDQEPSDLRHRWDRDGERCLKCRDKVWIGGPCSTTDDEYIATLTAERDAAIREREGLKARVAELEAASGVNGQATPDGSTHAASGDNSSAKPKSSRHTERDFPPPDAFVDALHDPVGPTSGKRLRAKKLTLGASGRNSSFTADSQTAASGGEQEPVAWGVRNPKDLLKCGEGPVWSVRATKEIAERAFPASEGWIHFPLFDAPPPPRGWLTEEERACLEKMRDELKRLLLAMSLKTVIGQNTERDFIAIESILARSSPPEVVLDALPTDESGELFSRHDVIAALAAAGVKVKEVK